MKFRSNNCIAIHLKSLAKAEKFYSDVLGFKLKNKSKTIWNMIPDIFYNISINLLKPSHLFPPLI